MLHYVCVCVCVARDTDGPLVTAAASIAPGDVAHMWRAESHMAALWLSATGHQLLLLGFTTATRTFSPVASSHLLLKHALSLTACVLTADLSIE